MLDCDFLPYSASLDRRSRRPSAKRMTQCTGLSERIREGVHKPLDIPWSTLKSILVTLSVGSTHATVYPPPQPPGQLMADPSAWGGQRHIGPRHEYQLIKQQDIDILHVMIDDFVENNLRSQSAPDRRCGLCGRERIGYWSILPWTGRRQIPAIGPEVTSLDIRGTGGPI